MQKKDKIEEKEIKSKQSNNEDNEEKQNVINFKTDEWKDVTPIPQFSDNVQVLRIQYPEEYDITLNYFRGILDKQELSERAYNLTTSVLSMNPTNYAAWHLRRKCLDNCKSLSCQKELEWLDTLMVENQKNYQIWQHRKAIIDKLNDPSHEKAILKAVFDEDSKNFHAWCHRIWVMRRFDIIEHEMEFIEDMLADDIKNNSVWNYRFFFINYEKIFKNASDKEINEIIKNEIQYAIDKIQLCPVNESAYSYLRGYLNKYNKKYSDYPIIKETMLELMKKGSINHTLSMVVDIYEEEKNTAKAIEIIDELIILDYIRKKYWGWRKKQLE